MHTRSKISLTVILTALASVTGFGILNYIDSRAALQASAIEELSVIRDNKAKAVEAYFEKFSDDTEAFARDPQINAALKEFRAAFADLQNGEGAFPSDMSSLIRDHYERRILPRIGKTQETGKASFDDYGPRSRGARFLQYTYLMKGELPQSRNANPYASAYLQHNATLSAQTEMKGYEDLYLVDQSTGTIVYTASQGMDLGANIYTGALSDSGLGRIVEASEFDQSTRISDFELYAPAVLTPSVFSAAPIIEDGVQIGTLVLRASADVINASYALNDVQGRDVFLTSDDYLRRTNAPAAADNLNAYVRVMRDKGETEAVVDAVKRHKTTILSMPVKSSAAMAALRGQTNAGLTKDSQGHSVIAAYAPIRVQDNDWVIVAQADTAQVFAPLTQWTRRTMIALSIFLPILIIFSLWMAARLMRPARRMTETATRVADGNWEIRFDDAGFDEWGKLGKALNRHLFPAPFIDTKPRQIKPIVTKSPIGLKSIEIDDEKEAVKARPATKKVSRETQKPNKKAPIKVKAKTATVKNPAEIKRKHVKVSASVAPSAAPVVKKPVIASKVTPKVSAGVAPVKPKLVPQPQPKPTKAAQAVGAAEPKSVKTERRKKQPLTKKQATPKMKNVKPATKKPEPGLKKARVNPPRVRTLKAAPAALTPAKATAAAKTPAKTKKPAVKSADVRKPDFHKVPEDSSLSKNVKDRAPASPVPTETVEPLSEIRPRRLRRRFR